MSALLSVKNPASFKSQFPPKKEYKDYKKMKYERFCDHCKQKGHTKDQCFKLVGYPEWYVDLKGKKPQNSSNRVAAAVHDSSGILGNFPTDTPLDLEPGSSLNHSSSAMNTQMLSAVCKEVFKMMQNNNSEYHPSINFSGIVSAFNVILSNKHANNAWIIDTGASDHMAFNLEMFANTRMLKTPIHIALPDGTLKIVDTIGTIILTPEITLYNVFFCPQFKHNLLSVGRLLDQNQLYAKFEKNLCTF